MELLIGKGLINFRIFMKMLREGRNDKKRSIVLAWNLSALSNQIPILQNITNVKLKIETLTKYIKGLVNIIQVVENDLKLI